MTEDIPMGLSYAPAYEEIEVRLDCHGPCGRTNLPTSAFSKRNDSVKKRDQGCATPGPFLLGRTQLALAQGLSSLLCCLTPLDAELDDTLLLQESLA